MHKGSGLAIGERVERDHILFDGILCTTLTSERREEGTCVLATLTRSMLGLKGKKRTLQGATGDMSLCTSHFLKQDKPPPYIPSLLLVTEC